MVRLHLVFAYKVLLEFLIMHLWIGTIDILTQCAPLAALYMSIVKKVSVESPGAPFYWHGLTLISAWISNYIHYKMWDEIIYPFLNFNGATVEI